MTQSLFSFFRKESGEVGHIRQITKGLIQTDGLLKIRLNEMVVFEGGQIGYVFGLKQNLVEIALLSGDSPTINQQVTRTNKPVSIAIDDGIFGKQVDSLVNLQAKHLMETTSQLMPIDATPRSVGERLTIDEPLVSQINAVDLLLPLGKGQRELLIGDRASGKTTTAIQIAQAQASMGVKVIYTVIGKRTQEILQVEDQLFNHPAKDNIVLVAAPAYKPIGHIIIAPFTAMTIAEYVNNQGTDALVVFDDLTLHAKYYREMSLLADRFPGRESFPGDVFYLHARLLERAGKFRHSNGAVTISALPMAESIGSSLNGFIQTNLMSVTDGHMFFDTEMFYSGIRPAINPFLSVTRVGKQTQSRLRQQTAQLALEILQNHRNAIEFSRFGADLTGRIVDEIERGEKLWKLLTQRPDVFISYHLQVFILSAIAFTTMTIEEIEAAISTYASNPQYKKAIDKLSDFEDIPQLREHILKMMESSEKTKKETK